MSTTADAVSGRWVATMKALGVAAVLFVSLYIITHPSVIGSEVIPCSGSLVVYCWTADLIGTGLAWALWHGLFSLAAGWAIVALSLSKPHDPEGGVVVVTRHDIDGRGGDVELVRDEL